MTIATRGGGVHTIRDNDKGGEYDDSDKGGHLL